MTRCQDCYAWHDEPQCPLCAKVQELIAAEWPFVVTKDDQKFLRTNRIALLTPTTDTEDDCA